MWSEPPSVSIFQSTPPTRGATLEIRERANNLCISIHAPYTGSDPTSTLSLRTNVVFQSTPPTRGATKSFDDRIYRLFISIHAPYTGSDLAIRQFYNCITISIHAPYTGSDILGLRSQVEIRISIHAPYTGSDCPESKLQGLQLDFNPRPLHGERLRSYTHGLPCMIFQSTPPTRGATYLVDWPFQKSSEFQSTPPTRGATDDFSVVASVYAISIHAPYTGSDLVESDSMSIDDQFQSTPPTRGATLLQLNCLI